MTPFFALRSLVVMVCTVVSASVQADAFGTATTAPAAGLTDRLTKLEQELKEFREKSASLPAPSAPSSPGSASLPAISEGQTADQVEAALERAYVYLGQVNGLHIVKRKVDGADRRFLYNEAEYAKFVKEQKAKAARTVVVPMLTITAPPGQAKEPKGAAPLPPPLISASSASKTVAK